MTLRIPVWETEWMVIPSSDMGKCKTDLFIIIFLGKRENEFSFGDAEFQVLEGLSFIHLTNLWWQPAVMTEGHFF